MINYREFKDKIHQIKETIPQIIAFSSINEKGFTFLKKKVMNYLEIDATLPVAISSENEILLTTKEVGVKLTILPGNRIQLPSYALKKLKITKKTKICFIQRKNAVAIKKFEIKISNARLPKIVDFETPFLVTRQVETSADPLETYEQLKEQYSKLKLKFNVKKFWQKKKSFYAWKARRILGSKEDSDEELQIDLIQERLQAQNTNGTWQNNIILTAKNILELNELGLNSNHPQIQKAISWLIDQPESPHNPGMFFLKEELVNEQMDIVKRRKEQTSGSRDRFRKRVSSEIKQITAYDNLYFNPCGQRIIWANAIVLEALLAFGYEFHNRIQNALDTLAFTRWCECAYQHGKSDWRRKNSMSLKEIDNFQKQTMFEFNHGGINNLKLLVIIPSQNHFLRIKEDITQNHIEYELRMPMPQQGCEYITTGALHHVRDEKINGLVGAHLWRFAILLNNALKQPEMALELVKYNITNYFQLQVLAKYSSLPAKLGIHIALPWIIQNQNDDGSWGNEKFKESATLAIINALKRINFF